MIGAEEQIVIVQPGQQGLEIVTPPLQFDVVAAGDIVDADVQHGAARKPAGDLLA